MLNWMLHHDRLQGTLGLTSIGRDGESTDVVTGTEKPGIFVREGTLIATARICCGWGHHAGDHGDHRHPHAAGEVVIFRARSDGNVQLAGPSITTQLKEVSRLFFEMGPTSPSSTALWAASLWAHGPWRRVILCTGASYHMSIDKVVADTAHVYRLMNLPKAETMPQRWRRVWRSA